jgi:hypothetical protein
MALPFAVVGVGRNKAGGRAIPLIRVKNSE